MSEIGFLTLERDGDVAVASASGEIDFSNAGDMGLRIARWISNEDAALLLDLTKLSYTDSSGINLVFELASRLHERGQTFGVVIPPDSQPWRTFSLVGVQAQIPVFGTVDEARASLTEERETLP